MEAGCMRLKWLVVFLVMFSLIITPKLDSDGLSPEARAYQEYGPCLYFPLDRYIPTHCGFYCYQYGGVWHGANDYVGQIGQPIRTVMDGVVIEATNGFGNTYPHQYIGGNYVKINHGNLESSYSHLSISIVKSGDIVRTGEMIGKMGNTGYSTGTHLHLCIRYNGEKLNLEDSRYRLWKGNPPIPAIKAQLARKTDREIRQSCKVFADLFPIEPKLQNPFGKEFRVVRCNIENGQTEVSPVKHILIRFSQPVELADFDRAIELEPYLLVNNGIFDYPHKNDRSLIRIWGNTFNANQRYRLSINNLHSTTGDELIAWSISFKTGDWPITPFGKSDRELLIEKGPIRLGNNLYQGEVNSNFSRKATTTSWQSQFELETIPPVVTLEYRSRGIENTACIINGTRIQLQTNYPEDNGRKINKKLPRKIFIQGTNTIQIELGKNSYGDIDDIEIWDLKLLY